MTFGKRKYNKKYYQKNKIKVLKECKEWRENNPEKVREIHNKWILENKEKYRKHRQEYYLKNRNKSLEYSKQYFKKHYKYKERILREDVWENARIKALERDDYTCQMCKSKIRIEVHHIDGSGSNKKAKQKNNKLSNLISLCHKCHIQVEILKVGSFNGGKCKRDIIRDKRIFRLSKKFSQTRIAKLEGLTRQRIHQIVKKEKEKVSNT